MSVFAKSPFDKALEKATSQLLLDVDWDAVLQICDLIRQEDVQPKYALAAMRKKISSDNPHVSMFALQTLESVVKNCGSLIHNEIATKDFMEYMKDLCKLRTDPVKTKLLELIQIWSHAFRNETSFRIVTDTFNLMKVEGYTFPVLKEADAMFSAEKAPEWKESDVCARCRTAFGVVNRRHHCRHCGDVFCAKCSSRASIIPKFGIEREVRVCESCFEVLNPTQAKKDGDSLPVEYLASPLSKQSQAPPTKSEQDLKEKEELELALALSQSEQESKRKTTPGNFYNSASNDSAYRAGPSNDVCPIDTSQLDPELAHYLNRNYWENKSDVMKSVPSATSNVSATTTPSAPAANTEPMNAPIRVQEAYQNGATDRDEDQFLSALVGSVEIFVNRMKSNSMRGRSIANDTAVQSLFTAISNMHPQLMTYLQQQEEMRGNYETLQDKLAQLRDAREALDALREDHHEKKRREFEEMERRRQIQMAHKLEIMRQKKHEYLEAQRQHALQKLQEQERELQLRFEKQKQLTQMRQMQAYAYPQQLYNQAMGQPSMDPMQQQQMQGGYMPQGVMMQQPPPAGSVGPSPHVSVAGSNTSIHGGSNTQLPVMPGPADPQAVSSGQAIQYQPPMPGQPGMPQAGPQSGQVPGAPMPGVYQIQGGAYPQYNPTVGQPPPPQQQGYPQMNQAFNMQGMASNLPNQSGYVPQQQPQGQGYTPPDQGQNQAPGQPGQHQQGQFPPQQQQQPQQQPQQPQQQPQQQQPQQQQAQQQQPQQHKDVQLISFD